MTYIRNPHDANFWESDGDLNGKFMARDGTLHDSPEDVWDYEDEHAECKEALGEKL